MNIFKRLFTQRQKIDQALDISVELRYLNDICANDPDKYYFINELTDYQSDDLEGVRILRDIAARTLHNWDESEYDLEFNMNLPEFVEVLTNNLIDEFEGYPKAQVIVRDW